MIRNYWRRVETNVKRFTAGCVGKVQHPSKNHALAVCKLKVRKAAKRLEHDPTYDAEYYHALSEEPYRCSCCKSWHTGHPSAAIEKRRELEKRDDRIMATLRSNQTEALLD